MKDFDFHAMEHTLLWRIMKMLMLQQFLTLLIICNWFHLASGQKLSTPRSVSDIANPLNDPEKCGQKGISHICNPDGIIPIEQAPQLDDIIRSIYNDTVCTSCPTSCRSGYRIGIAVIEAMKLDKSIHKLNDATSKDQAKYLDAVLKEAKHYAYTLLRNWKMGLCNEDVLVFFSKNDSVLYTVTNSEAQKKLTNDVVGEIAMHSRIKFSNPGNITEGFKEILNNYRLVFLNNYTRNSFWETERHSPQVSGSKTNYLRNCYTTLLLLFSAAAVWKLAT